MVNKRTIKRRIKEVIEEQSTPLPTERKKTKSVGPSLTSKWRTVVVTPPRTTKGKKAKTPKK
ncbi:hypothetical protein MKW92_043954, partial [Papaver armeniacum]